MNETPESKAIEQLAISIDNLADSLMKGLRELAEAVENGASDVNNGLTHVGDMISESEE